MNWELRCSIARPDATELFVALLWDRGPVAVAIDDSVGLVTAGFERERDARRAANELFDLSAVPSVVESLEVRPAPDWPGLPAGEVVVGSHHLLIDAGRSFGHGGHPTTGLCLELLEDLSSSWRPAPRVVDVGCGSGVLSIAAAVLGAAEVWAVDIDPDALAATERNSEANDVEIELVDGLCRLPSTPSFDLVVVNMLLADLRTLAPGLEGLLAPASTQLVASGFLAEQSGDALALLGDPEVLDERRRDAAGGGEWVAVHAAGRR